MEQHIIEFGLFVAFFCFYRGLVNAK